MNYLAHAFLSPGNDEILLGNMSCDMIKPAAHKLLSPLVLEGIKLHQRIDRTADKNRGFKIIRASLHSEGIPYAGVLVDIVCDHYLARFWNDYSRESLRDFSKRIYSVLSTKAPLLPGHFPRLASYLQKEDWFGHFRTVEGLQAGITRLNYRSSKEIPVYQVMRTVLEKEDLFISSFHILMANLCEDFIHPTET